MFHQQFNHLYSWPLLMTTETLTRAAMHCTNGIIIQRESGDDQPDEAPTEENTNPPVKIKSFAPVNIEITPYDQLQRVPPDINTWDRTEYKYHQISSKNTYQRREIFFGFFFEDRKHATQIIKNKPFLDGRGFTMKKRMLQTNLFMTFIISQQ